MVGLAQQFRNKLHSASVGIPADFSIVPTHQIIPYDVLREIDRFIEVFEQVTTRSMWQQVTLQTAPKIARLIRNEVCFFSAWDLHLPQGHQQDWQMIEFNDNGSGFLFAALINRVYYDLFLSAHLNSASTPPSYYQLCSQIKQMLDCETNAFFGHRPNGLLLILDDAHSLQKGKFRSEHQLLARLAHELGWRTAIGSPEILEWKREELVIDGQAVSFIINRSTDFLWEGEQLIPLHQAYRAGRVYIAPNPFSYATRSDKRLLEYLSRPNWDEELGIRAEERYVLSQHIPPTYLISDENIGEITAHKKDYIFKPTHGHAGLGVFNSDEVGRNRLQRLLAKGQVYVAQKEVKKSELLLETNELLWSDLRVWAYRGRRFLISGRASCSKDRLILSPPGGWLPTFQEK